MRKRELIQGCVSERGGVYRQSTGDVRSEKGRENQKGRQKNTLAETGGEDNKKRKEYTAPTDDTSSPSGLCTWCGLGTQEPRSVFPEPGKGGV